jgi:hypothetical protein
VYGTYHGKHGAPRGAVLPDINLPDSSGLDQLIKLARRRLTSIAGHGRAKVLLRK